MKYLLKLSYVGTGFSGFQVQTKSEAKTIQGELCRAARELFGTECKVTGCSRTDAGVHANEYYATLEADTENVVPPERLPLAIASFLPKTIVVKFAQKVPESYSVRRRVSEKEYVYRIENTPLPSPFNAYRAWNVPFALNVDKMNEAASYIVGKHDFSSFMASGSKIIDATRSVSVCRVKKDGDTVELFIRADGFLYNMVRIIVGTLVDVGRGYRQAREVADIIASKDRASAGPTAPPDGLYLNKVILK